MVLALLLAAALFAAPAADADEAAPLYETGAVAVVDLTLSNTAKAELEAEPDEYVEGTFELGIDDDGAPGGHVTELTSAPLTVGIRLKGTVGSSFRPLTGKSSFKIKFKQFGGPKFRGLKKLTLNNMAEDPSMIHEALTYTTFRELGVPASRTGYAFVRVNGEPYGVYLDIEDVDDVALKRIFGSFDEGSQHLYEGENGADVVPGGAAEFEVDEGDEGDVSDLEALIGAVNGNEPASFSARVASVADLDELTKMWAIEKYVGRWDGYAGKPETANQPNNYFLYSGPTGVFQMMPWGSDETWEERLDFGGHDGRMFNLCLEDATCAAEYWKALQGVHEAIAGLGLDDLAAGLAKLLEPWQEDDPRKEESMSQIRTAVAAARAFIAARPGEADDWLQAHEPPAEEPPAEEPPAEEPPAEEPPAEEPPAEEPPAEEPGTGGSPGNGQPSGPPPPDSQPGSDPLLRIAGVSRHRDRLMFRIRLLTPGRVEEDVSVGIRGARRRVCSPVAGADRAETLTLTCDLPRFVRDLRRRRPLTLRVVTEARAADGDVETTTRRVTVPRDQR